MILYKLKLAAYAYLRRTRIVGAEDSYPHKNLARSKKESYNSSIKKIRHLRLRQLNWPTKAFTLIPKA